ncbi:MAG: prepilin-type N-terminal cleavage/methylation domain-containing protein [Phycisphaerales bacterium]
MTRPRRAFTLIELLVVIAVVALLIAILLPALAGARSSAQAAVCLSNQRQLVTAWTGYALDHNERAMPYLDERGSTRRYWFGEERTDESLVDARRGVLGPYLAAQTGDRSVFECPSQRDGSYTRQGDLADNAWTSTYGYNAYYLTPDTSQHYGIDSFPGVRVSGIHRPTDLFVFGDTMIVLWGTLKNSALLDPPQLFSRGRGWKPNSAPTTSFRHGGAAATARADGSVGATRSERGWLVHESPALIGSVGLDNGPHYVPDWERWTFHGTR